MAWNNLSENYRFLYNFTLELNAEHLLENNVALLIKSWKARKRPSALDKMIDEMKKSAI